jgi:hypothetical protein
MKLVLLFFLLPLVLGASPKNEFIFDKGQVWTATEEAQRKFAEFLKKRRRLLLEKFPKLFFPESIQTKNEFNLFTLSGEKEYSNRQVSCAFLEKVRSALVDAPAKLRFEKLTHSKNICIAADLSSEKKALWPLELARFLWSENWIKVNNHVFSLESYLKNKLKNSYIAPEISFLSQIAYDGYGYGQSFTEQQFIKSIPALRKIFINSNLLDPNQPSLFTGLSAGLIELIKSDPYNWGEPFIPKPIIFISANWSPESLPEILVHEYGHVYHSMKGDRFSRTNEGQTRYFNDHVLFEGVAEAFAWNNLYELYANYPELEIFHIFKLQYFEQNKPNDAHYLGALALQELFHREEAVATSALEELIKAHSLKEFLEAKKLNTVIDHGKKARTVVELN